MMAMLADLLVPMGFWCLLSLSFITHHVVVADVVGGGDGGDGVDDGDVAALVIDGSSDSDSDSDDDGGSIPAGVV